MRKLPVAAIIRETLVLVWQKRAVLFRALIATAIALAALDTLDTLMKPALKGQGSASAWLLIVLSMILSSALYTLFAVTCHRIVLLGDKYVPKYGMYSWTSRETKFFGWIVVVSLYGLLAFVAILLVGVVVGFLAQSAVKGHIDDWLFLVAVMGMVPILYISARLAVLFPATAIGERRDTDWAFAVTAKNGWRMAGALYFIGPVSLGLHALPVDRGMLVDFLMRLLSSVFVAVGIVALSLSFRFLSAGSEAGGSAS